ncbi:MAG: hypothetical protein KGO53_08340 [Alphaproteobacteria bacterium]|nr:hypothetical protein [Alphaproteobacteria bacterium]
MSLTFAPLVGSLWLIAFAAAVVALTVFLFWKRARGALLRGLTGAVLLAALANPVFHQNEREALNDIAVLVVDHSDSQKLGTRMAQTDKAAEDLKQRITALPNTEVRIVTVTSGVEEGHDGTRAFAALTRALADIPQNRFAGAVFITDGQIHDVPQGKALAQLPGPLHGLISGSRKESDRRLVIDHAPQFTLVGQSAKITFHVEDQGGNGDVEVTVSPAGAEAKRLVVKPGVQAEVDVDVSHAGKNFISLSAATRQGELSTANNQALAVVEGIRDRLRVLLVSGQPNPGERTWRNLLKADSAVDLVHFTILRPPEKQDGTPNTELSLIAFPTKELFVDKLDKFDLVIFDRYQREAILPDSFIGNIADYVRKGGALLVSSGPDFAEADGLASTPLGDVLAAQPTGQVINTPYKPLLTQSGERHPVTQSLPGASATDPKWGTWFRIIDATADADPATEVLMQGPEAKPLLVLRRVEQGRVAQILSDQGWLWSRGYEGGGPEAEMLKRISHWLMKEPELEEDRLTAHQSGTDIVVDRFGLGDNYKSASLQWPSGKATDVPLSQVSPGHFSGHVPAIEPGLVLVRDGALETVVEVGAGDAREMSDLLATDKKLQPAAAATGGGVFWLEDGLPHIAKQGGTGAFAGAGWFNLKANGQYKVLAIREVALFSSLLSLAALLLAACFMWAREGR